MNGPRQVFAEREGMLHLEPVRFDDEAHLRHVIDRIVSAVGRRVDESSPMVDARLPDGSRVNAVVPPLALDGSLLTSASSRGRCSRSSRWSRPAAASAAAQRAAARRRGRAPASTSPSAAAPAPARPRCSMRSPRSSSPRERIVTVEDAAELRLPQPHVVRLESRPPNVEGRGEVTMRALVRNALRMRPDRIVVGEVRGGEALDMLQAMNTGHDGSMTTVHASLAGRRAAPAGDDGADGRRRPAARGGARAAALGGRRGRPHRPLRRRRSQGAVRGGPHPRPACARSTHGCCASCARSDAARAPDRGARWWGCSRGAGAGAAGAPCAARLVAAGRSASRAVTRAEQLAGVVPSLRRTCGPGARWPRRSAAAPRDLPHPSGVRVAAPRRASRWAGRPASPCGRWATTRTSTC